VKKEWKSCAKACIQELQVILFAALSAIPRQEGNQATGRLKPAPTRTIPQRDGVGAGSMEAMVRTPATGVEVSSAFARVTTRIGVVVVGALLAAPSVVGAGFIPARFASSSPPLDSLVLRSAFLFLISNLQDLIFTFLLTSFRYSANLVSQYVADC